MVLESFAALKEKLGTRHHIPKKVVVANPSDPHSLSAVLTLYREQILVPILVGDKAGIMAVLEQLPQFHITESELTIIDAKGDEAIANQAVKCVRQGQADVLMKGHIQTRDLLKAVVNKESGIRKQPVLSHVAINEVPAYHKLLFLTDGGMVLTPDLETKKAILMNALWLTKALGYVKTKVGILDASENVNPKLQASSDAVALKEMNQAGEFADAIVEGPISLDLSISERIAKEKGYTSPVAGDADILVVPDIISGNLLGKSMMTLAHGKMAGLVLGASVPIIITSRGSSTEEKINSLLIACAI